MDNKSNTEKRTEVSGKTIVKNLIAGAVILVIVITGLIILLNKDSQINELHIETHRLDEIIQKRDSVINELDGAISEIEQNISFIKSKREQLEFEYRESSQNQKDRIVEDIILMDSMLAESEQKMEQLTKKLHDSNIELDSFRKRMAVLNSELKNQTQVVSNLKKELENKDAQLADMGKKMEQLETVIVVQTDSLTALADSVEQATARLRLLDQQLYKAFWVLGTFKELRNNNILAREGGFLGLGKNKILSNDLNEDYFTELDIRETEIIPLNAKKAQMISDHAANSYRFVYQDDLIAYLKIEDPYEFWKRTKYAVIEIKQ